VRITEIFSLKAQQLHSRLYSGFSNSLGLVLKDYIYTKSRTLFYMATQQTPVCEKGKRPVVATDRSKGLEIGLEICKNLKKGLDGCQRCMCFRRSGAGNGKYQAESVELLQHTCCSSTIISHWLYKDRLEPQVTPDCLTTSVFIPC